jgi:putative holliday junction resolvase
MSAYTPVNRPRGSRIIGVDFGIARIGLAISDEQKIIATPMLTLVSCKKSEETISKFLLEIKNYQEKNFCTIEEIVVGLPLMMSGKMGLLADEVKHFVDLLRKSCTIPIITWDERLTTVQAERSLREGSFSRRKRSKVVDVVAAQIILQNFLDHKKIQHQNREEQ